MMMMMMKIVDLARDGHETLKLETETRCSPPETETLKYKFY